MLKRVALKQLCLHEVRLYTTATAAAIDPSAAAAALASASTTTTSSSAKPFESIPIVKGAPLVGNLFQLIKRKNDFHYFLTEMNEKYGPIYRLQVPNVEMVVVSEPQDYQTILFAKDSMRGPVPLWRKYREDSGKPITLASLNYDEDWRSQRHVVNVMLRPPLVESYLPRLSVIADNLIDAINNNLDSRGIAPRMHKLFYRFGLEAILAVLYGRKAGLLNAVKEDENMVNLINGVIEMFATNAKLQTGILWKYFKTPTLKKHYSAWDQMLSSGKKLHHDSISNPDRANYFKDDIANAADIMLVQANSKNISEEMRDVLNAEVISGAIDTTGNALNAAMYALAKHPEIQERLYKEITSIVPDKKQPITSQDINKMPLLKDTIKEIFRVFPPVAQNVRTSTQSVVVSGYEVPAGKMFMMNFWASSHNPKYFENPYAFNPDRYKNLDKASVQNNLVAFAALPFGFGPRMCVGARVAHAELQASLSKIIMNFKLEYQGEYPPFLFKTINMFVPRNDDERVKLIPRK